MCKILLDEQNISEDTFDCRHMIVSVTVKQLLITLKNLICSDLLACL